MADSGRGGKDDGSREAAARAAEQLKASAMARAGAKAAKAAEMGAGGPGQGVNAYGQKEEGPSRWQERKEAKRQMYLMSTEKGATLRTRSDKQSVGQGTQQCQKCYKFGHWTYECKNERVYMARPTRTMQLKNPNKRQGFLDARELPAGPEFAQSAPVMADNKTTKPKKKRYSSSSSEDSRDESSGSDSGSDSDTESTSGSEASSASDTSTSGSDLEESSDSDDSQDRARHKKRGNVSKRVRRHSPSESKDSSSGESERRKSRHRHDTSSDSSKGSDRVTNNKSSRQNGKHSRR
eukprot:jgi/Chlat1/2103/Chrsp17S00185